MIGAAVANKLSVVHRNSCPHHSLKNRRPLGRRQLVNETAGHPGLRAASSLGSSDATTQSVEEMKNVKSGGFGFYSIIAECVATGRRHDDRVPGQIVLVDEEENVLLDIYVKPKKRVISYITPYTGLTKEKLDDGVLLETALEKLRSLLPPTATLVGQHIDRDIGLCQLKEGTDFKSMVNLLDVFQVYNPRYHTTARFSLAHVSNVILDVPITNEPHKPVQRAVNSIKLYKFHLQNHQDASIWNQTQRDLVHSPRPISFAKQHPKFEGVCMGHKKLCHCGAPPL